VISTLALAVASGLSIQEAIQLANLAASLVVSRFGAATVTLDEIADSLKTEREERKVVSVSEIDQALRHHRIQGRTIVFTNGCYDLFHAGHLELLKKAASFGDILVVGVNSDKSVKRIKGPQRPIVQESDRLAILSALNFVDYVAPFDEDTPLNLIKEVKPDVLVKGEDWKGKTVVGEKQVMEKGGRVKFVKLLPGISTSELIRKIKKS
jgi:D-beta-D-heptose 7-phosphate kinase/D-beta-D-heptose 1-phosphate adenosyltransferase